jgi:enamine deaminase RidA (YjgF/YER057c/UK114 family)
MNATTLVDIYNTKTGKWKKRAALAEARNYLQATIAGGKVYFSGGYPYALRTTLQTDF